MNFGNKLKQLKYENLKVFIRSDVHAVRAGIKLKGQPPLNNSKVYRQTEGRITCLLLLFEIYNVIRPAYRPRG